MSELARVSMGAIVPPTMSVEDVYREAQQVKRELWQARERLATQERLVRALRLALHAWEDYVNPQRCDRKPCQLVRAKKLTELALS